MAKTADAAKEKLKLSDDFSSKRQRIGDKCEECVAFDLKHYPKGLNANFLEGLAEEVVAQHVKKFENQECRDIAMAAPAVMTMLRDSASLQSSSVVADIGAGTGLFLERFSATASKVFAMEISPHFVAHLQHQAQLKGLQNVVVVQGTSQDPCLPADSVDLVFVCDVYHHFEYPKTVCQHLKAALREGGRLVVIDFIRDDAVHKSHEPGWILQHVRAGQEVFRAEIESAGFRLVAEPPVQGLAENYCMIFEPIA